MHGLLLMTPLYIFLEYFSYLFKCKKSLPTKLSWVMYNQRKHIFFKNKLWSLSFGLSFRPMYNSTHPPSYHNKDVMETFLLESLEAWFLLYVVQVYKLPWCCYDSQKDKLYQGCIYILHNTGESSFYFKIFL